MKQFLLLAAAVAVPILSPALAQPSTSERTQVVPFADLDLQSERDVRKLDRRIAAAAATLCGPMSDVDPAGKTRIRLCRQTALKGAAAKRARAIAAKAGTDSAAVRLTLDRLDGQPRPLRNR